MRRIVRIGVVAGLLAVGTACSGVGPFGSNGGNGVVLTPNDPIVGAVGATQRLQLLLSDDQIAIPPAEITWSTSNPGVAMVDATGLVTAAGDGSATITAQWNGLSDSTVITVAASIVFSAQVTAADQLDANPANNVGSATITITAVP